MIEVRGEKMPLIEGHCHVNWMGWTIRDVYDHFRSLGVDRAIVLSWDELIRRESGEYVLPCLRGPWASTRTSARPLAPCVLAQKRST